MRNYQVMFLCNDERGMPTGRVEAIEIHGEIRVVCTRDRGLKFRWDERQNRSSVRVGSYSFPHRNRQTCVGNVFWDSAELREDMARWLIRRLLSKGWAVEEHADEGPFADLARNP